MKLKGKTQDAACPFLPAAYFQKGTTLQGTVSRIFKVKGKGKDFGNCYEITLPKAITIAGEKVSKVAIGSLAGVMMAVQAAGTDDLEVGDVIALACTGSTDVGQMSDRIDFVIEIDRPDKRNR